MIRIVLGIVLGVLVLGLAGFGIWLFTLPPKPDVITPPPIAQAETDAALVALKPPKRARPVIAVIGINDATEVTDYLMPTGILRRADIADVLLVATGPGPVALYPALKVEPDTTITQFDADHPDGADYVIVPAMTRENDPAVIDWLRAQAGKGGIVVGVCVGAKVVANAGLLDGKRGTTHWFSRDAIRKEHSNLIYVPDRRLVVDGKVVTTTGITASIPISLTLIEAIAGREKAAAVAQSIGLADWDARHASAAFTFNRDFALTITGNVLAFWNREDLGLELAPGMDEVSLALVADAWSRTYRSRAITFAAEPGAVTTASGLRIVPDRTSWPADRRIAAIDAPPAATLDSTLAAIAQRFGEPTADVVAMQLEYPRKDR